MAWASARVMRRTISSFVDAVDYEEEEDRPAPVQQRKEERKKEREEAPAVAGNLGVDSEVPNELQSKVLWKV